MERRTLLAALLCLLVLVVYQEAIRHIYPPPPPPMDGEIESPPTPRTERDAPPPIAETGAALPESPAAVTGAIVPVETEVYSARVSTAGGRLVSFRLKQYRSAVDERSEPLEVIEVAPSVSAPLGVRFLAEDGRVQDDTAVEYSADRDGMTLSGARTGVLTLTGVLPSGARVEKKLAFTGDAYTIEVTIGSEDLPTSFSRVGLSWRRHVLSPAGSDPEAYYRGAVLLSKNKVLHELATSLAGAPPKQFEPPITWAGYNDHYFLAAIVPEDPLESAAVVSAEERGVQILLTSARGVDGGGRFTLYVGPKDVDILSAAGNNLARAVDFGWFAFLAIPLLRLLKLFHVATGNYGIDIILLTILVKILFIPLSNKSMKSMREMQRLQPQMAKLREKFKDDREQLNKETMELYRRHRVNPLGGCLPMLLQFPVFIGLYQGLNQAIELRHAAFALWVRDLSTYECYPWPGQVAALGCNDLSLLGVPIPFLVLLMGGSMILQQWVSPATGMDPVQQRMMTVLMPLMFTVMFVNFPSGLVLYWLVNNVLTIAQTWWMNRATE